MIDALLEYPRFIPELNIILHSCHHESVGMKIFEAMKMMVRMVKMILEMMT